MTLLQRMTQQRREANESLRQRVRVELASALAEVLPGTTVTVFGSLVKAGRFTGDSDVDVALAEEPASISVFQLSSLLGERLGRSVDVVLLPECRFRARIEREGEVWTLPG